MILVCLTVTLFSEKMLISTRCICGFMSNSIKKSWKDSTTGDKISSHGDYLRGRIKLPPNLNYSRYKLELGLVSSPDSDQTIFLVHPYLLHLTQPDTFLPMTDVNKESWKLTFDLDVQSGVIFQNHNGSTLKLPFNQDAPYITLGKL